MQFAFPKPEEGGDFLPWMDKALSDMNARRDR